LLFASALHYSLTHFTVGHN